MNPHHQEAINKMGRKPINPIGQCFDSAAYQAVLGKDPPPDLRLCHGIGVANMPGQAGEPIAHAWVEIDFPDRGRAAFDTTWGLWQEAAAYRRGFQCSYVHEYTRGEALVLWAKHDMPGPWDPKIRAVVERNAAARKVVTGILDHAERKSGEVVGCGLLPAARPSCRRLLVHLDGQRARHALPELRGGLGMTKEKSGAAAKADGREGKVAERHSSLTRLRSAHPFDRLNDSDWQDALAILGSVRTDAQAGTFKRAERTLHLRAVRARAAYKQAKAEKRERSILEMYKGEQDEAERCWESIKALMEEKFRSTLPKERK